ncbi:MAG: hypothetical protein NTX76_02720 [Alphaproteobacteria bacterium]|nr:hypothetical protein [Alphaproteobacteria bacterium]
MPIPDDSPHVIPRLDRGIHIDPVPWSTIWPRGDGGIVLWEISQKDTQ